MKKRFRIYSAWLILLPGLVLWMTSSCKHEGIPADQLEQICFKRDVLPIFQNSCGTTGCHDATSAGHGYVFIDYATIMQSIQPGNADKSKAYQAITSTFQLMPPDNALPASKRTLIRLWIEQGARETTCQTNVTSAIKP